MKIEDKLKKLLKKMKNCKMRNVDDVREISYNELKEFMKNFDDVKLVDIRSPQEFAEGRLNYAINIPLYELNKKATSILLDKKALIILYCQYGMRSKKAYEILRNMGYSNLYSLKGRFG